MSDKSTETLVHRMPLRPPPPNGLLTPPNSGITCDHTSQHHAFPLCLPQGILAHLVYPQLTRTILTPPQRGGGGGFGMTPWCIVLVCSWRRLLADRHSLPFPWTLSLHRQWCPSASHHPLTFLFLPALTFPLPFPFPSLGLSLRRPQCPSASHHSFPSHSLSRLCQGRFWQEAMVLCSRLQLASPTGRSPFAALPFPFLQ